MVCARHCTRYCYRPRVALWLVTRREVRRTDPDVVHGHWLLPGGLIVALSRAGPAPLVITLHGTDVKLAAGVSVRSCAASPGAPMCCWP